MHPTVSGILMMIGAVVWFVGGLAVDIIFFYPPILFIFGLIQFFRGLFSSSSSDTPTYPQNQINYGPQYGQNYNQGYSNPSQYPPQGYGQQYPQQGYGQQYPQQGNPYQDK